MLKPLGLALAFMLAASFALAAPVPGTSVSLFPPDGFVQASRFTGFTDQATGASIVVSEIPAPYDKVTAGFSDPERMAKRGMKLLDKTPVKVDGNMATLLRVEQKAYGQIYNKWIVSVKRPKTTVLIVATFPRSLAEKLDQPLKSSIMAATFGKPGDPIDALGFTATPVEPFQVAKVLANSMLLSPGGRFPVKDKNIPVLIIGLSFSEKMAIKDRKSFAELRIAKTATISDIAITKTLPITIGELSGYETVAKGIGKDAAATPLTLYQVMLFDKSGYCLIQGVTPSAKESTSLPIFQKIAKTFKLK